jgi:hypothetical protein
VFKGQRLDELWKLHLRGESHPAAWTSKERTSMV